MQEDLEISDFAPSENLSDKDDDDNGNVISESYHSDTESSSRFSLLFYFAYYPVDFLFFSNVCYSW